ncbi:TetR-like C-terminal domain-containing protein [Burkholderia sp. BCCIQ04A]|uniref:TetR-like C-terminal domain-containing protein n=1 Tax=Burkholderia anthinoferrum TaxID=3090833 RepID=A0ABU5WXP3_9BURK|nr:MULTISPECIES: TetR-like C-terminal domain-containing protein [Burkholderia]MEB2507017.1 TetR-like C-terminal domain-containing protein [Burkholderia anthinoferrum]MEB2532041.1 TetR-like C-terminal domain-containing protein [Burkholderia anthinoferrum]MEB2564874.1 TetR-like C-terminal domain-containing protein [Burkholderia anthinoferrum]MEB2583719.1 TetR-like C-terminal domain-containing protein [Burkholderia anthinoferrum]KVH07495.1 TetR family transcriptional regulator [Burkholderia anthi
MARVGITVDKLVEAGAQLADETGFEQLTGAALARHFDVKLASLYSHVASFDDLKSRIALFALQELAERAADALAGRTGKDALAALANVYRDYARAHPGRFAAARHPVSGGRATASAGGQLVRMTAAVLRSYGLPDSEQAHAIRLLGGFFMGYVTLESAGGFSHSAPDSDVSWARSLDALDVMLRHWPSAA